MIVTAFPFVMWYVLGAERFERVFPCSCYGAIILISDVVILISSIWYMFYKWTEGIAGLWIALILITLALLMFPVT